MVSSYPLTELLVSGRWGEVRAVVTGNGKNCTRDFLENELDKIKIGKLPVTTVGDRCLEWFQILADEGRLPEKRFRNEALGFIACCFEIKGKQIRFPCFRDGQAWIITHGFFKPGAKKGLGRWPDEHVQRATSLRAEYRNRKQIMSG